jgi:alkanesulfonate monooxygenase SsuD/methylene tetrahydromethanopterin reductase-like flavin-dependent oxidoreductase (luciferase family)
MDIRFGVSFDGFEDTPTALATARQVVAAGASSLWMAEHMGYREAMVTSMGFRINDPGALVVPTAVSPYLWHPSPTAMSLATLAEVGHAPVGIAVGVGNPLFLAESGKSADKPIRAVREFIECLRALWTGDAAHYQGEMFQLAGARLGFHPPQPLIVYVAAMGEQMLALAARIADGVALSAGLSAPFCKFSLQKVEASARAAGRDPASLRRASYLFFAVSEDGRKAVELVRPKLAFLLRNRALKDNIAMTGIPVDQERIIDAISRRDLVEAARLVSDDAIEAFGICGTVRACRDRLATYIDSGINEPVLMVLGEKPERELALAFLREQTGASASKP